MTVHETCCPWYGNSIRGKPHSRVQVKIYPIPGADSLKERVITHAVDGTVALVTLRPSSRLESIVAHACRYRHMNDYDAALKEVTAAGVWWCVFGVPTGCMQVTHGSLCC